MSAVLKAKRCRVCRREFIPARPLQCCCQYSCAITYSKGSEKRQSAATKRMQAAERAERREQLQKLVPLSKLKNRAQTAFNRWVRERDANEGCISCHMPANYGGQWHAGHYRTTAAASHLRFHPDNCHKQCSQCNNHKSGNTVEYRKRLIDKIGLERVESLENDNRIVKWTREDMIATRKRFNEAWASLKASA